MSFINKVVLITGAGSGIGKNSALHFAKLSARLSIVDINEGELKKTAENCEKLNRAKVLKITANLTIDEDVKRAVQATIQEYGRIDVVVNSAGIYGPGTILDSNLMETFDRIIAINLRSIVGLTHYAAPALIESKGSIINISSNAAEAVMTNIPYTVSKASLNHFTKCIALELAPKGVRVNSIMPGTVKTNILQHQVNFEENELYYRNSEKIAPLKRIVKVEEVAELIAYLASDIARSITGVNYLIDAGLNLTSTQDADQALTRVAKTI